MFLAANRNKRSIALDVKSRRGLEVAERLVQRADVLVEAYRSGVMERLGLGAEAVWKANPSLVYASISGFGARSPSSVRRAVDAVAQAEAGMIAANEGAEAPFTIVDTTSGLLLAQAVLAALVQRARTGCGRHVEVALLATALHLQSVPLADHAVSGVTLTPSERARRAPTAGLFRASDGLVYVAAHYEADVRTLLAVLDLADLTDDPRFATREARVANGEALQAALDERFQKATRAEWFEALAARDVMVAVVRDHAEVLEDEALVREGWLMPDSASGATLAALPYTMGGSPLPLRLSPPVLGAHTRAVLGEAGYDEAQISELVAAGVVASTAPDEREDPQ
jgi:crotonobetainyl-CoA:carnitine CoA-transferase CaiB-like acyl-CoA transferase